MDEQVFTVSLLTRKIRLLLEDGLPVLWVEGEVSNYKQHGSGHRYFTLKDEGAQIACVMWRTRKAPQFQMKDGLRLRAYARVVVWEQGGRYQLEIQSVMQVGLGELQAAFEALKKKLTEEGLFDLNRKKKLPPFPRRIGIATSATGAAIRDLVWGFRKRLPALDLYLIPVAVQGQIASREISAAIETFNQHKLVDVIVIGRGGGSLEDLWAFNEEVVVRAIAGSKIPVVSAVGHEVDVSLSDFAADLRAPTPTAVGSLVVPDRQEIVDRLNKQAARMLHSLNQIIFLWRERLQGREKSYGYQRVLASVGEKRIKLDELDQLLRMKITRKFDDLKKSLEHQAIQLQALSPKEVLNRGYCIARRDDGVIIRRHDQVKPGEELALKFGTGGSAVYVLEVWSDDRK